MLKRLLPLSLVVAYPLLVHISVLFNIAELQVVAIILMLLGAFLPALLLWRLIPWLTFMLLSCAILALSYFSLTLYLLYLPPIVVPLALLIFFGRTLRKGQQPLITAIADAARGPLTPAMTNYTRLLTQLWCGVFFIMLIWSAILPWLQQPALWSWFTNVINYGVVGVLFGGEFLLRKKLFPHHSHPNFMQYLRIIAQSNMRR